MAEKGKNWKIKELPLFPFLLFIPPPPRVQYTADTSLLLDPQVFKNKNTTLNYDFSNQ